MDLIRRMLLAARSSDDGKLYNRWDDVADEVFAEHVALLMEAGLVEGHLMPNGDAGPRYCDGFISRLTWAGQEFAEKIEDGARWKAAIEYLTKQGVTLSIDLLLTYFKSQVGG